MLVCFIVGIVPAVGHFLSLRARHRGSGLPAIGYGVFYNDSGRF